MERHDFGSSTPNYFLFKMDGVDYCLKEASIESTVLSGDFRLGSTPVEMTDDEERPMTPKGIGKAALGAMFGLPGAVVGALIGGGGKGLLGGFGTPPSFAWNGGSGTAPYGNNGTTNWKSGTTNALGGGNASHGPTNALSWTGTNGQPVTVVQDPWTGTYMSSF